ncbi:MAG: hypothetical protein RR627_00980, partial [Niameybacter sp.]
MRQKIRWVGIGILSVIICVILGFGVRAMGIQREINDEIEWMYEDVMLKQSIRIMNTPQVIQKETCGYATIEWMTSYLGKTLTENEILLENEGEITTSSTTGFQEELQKRVGDAYEVTMLSHVRNEKIIKSIHESLRKGMPVPISFEAIDHRNRPAYTLYFSVVTGMSLEDDEVYVSNVYGYEEVYSIESFLQRLKFENEALPTPIKIGKFFGLFDPNTIYIVQPKDEEDFKNLVKTDIVSNLSLTLTPTYERPEEQLKKLNSIFIKGLGSGEYVIVEVDGVLQDVQLVKLEWDETQKEVVEGEVLKDIGTV